MPTTSACYEPSLQRLGLLHFMLDTDLNPCDSVLSICPRPMRGGRPSHPSAVAEFGPCVESRVPFNGPVGPLIQPERE